ncbi:hypothetical protein IWQ60_009401 [Tieghemiomyces parasiticus]|uniref:Uncharacterized protein n=1 Tax=Tieghemiomyces parasiticus TaxID=78921 RepID=A0A9W7ZPE6_9FUNG|nr:hypothetical protein IWQ60_009401 [Tieghemiomyces parasiticus]
MTTYYPNNVGRPVPPTPDQVAASHTPYKRPVPPTPLERENSTAYSTAPSTLVSHGQTTVVDLYNQLNEATGFNPEVFRVKREKMEKTAQLMDAIPGLPVKVGLDGLIGLLPVGGDAINSAIALYIINLARQAGVPKSYRNKMIRNAAVNGLGGLVPLLGDVFAIIYRANIKNLELLDKWAKETRIERAKQWRLLAAQHPHLRLGSQPVPESLEDAKYLDQCIAAGIPFEVIGPSAAKTRGKWKFWGKKPQNERAASAPA